MATTVRAQADTAPRPTSVPDQSMQPWHFFVLAALACATAVTFMVRGQGWTAVILLTVLMGGAALIGLAMLRTVRPLVGQWSDRTSMIGQRTRVALEREKLLTLRAIKDLEFDKAMGKVSDEDFRDMEARLRSRAGRLMQQLDAGAGYREQVERDLTKRLGGARPVESAGPRSCATCSTENDQDAKFCKNCGAKL